MSEDHTYNGWSTYETWAANLWIDGLTVEDLINDPEEYDSDRDLTYDVAKALESYVDELDPLADSCTLFSDLLHAAMREINYYEIAEHYVSDYRYENPPTGSKNNPEVYKIEPELEPPTWWAFNSKGDDVDPYVESIESFWDAFEACIQDAIDNEYDSIVIEWKITEGDVTRWNEYKANHLIAKQSARNTKVGD